MKVFHQSLISLLAMLSFGVSAQQFEGIVRGLDYPGLSESCLDALNTTIADCPAFLASVSVDNPRLNSDQLAELCPAACRTALKTVRTTIASACKGPSDTIELPSGIIYPATLVIDKFIYTYDLSCRKDGSSGQYCDELFLDWLASQNSSTSMANCSDCSLGTMQTQLNSPFGYDEEFAQDFQAVITSCGATGYTFTAPATYSVGTDLPDPADDTSTPACSDPYIVQPGDSCDSIALAKGVSTYSIIRTGGLRLDCSNLLSGASLCLASPCTLYRVQQGDDCSRIIAAHSDVTGVSLLSWNPNISPLCSNMAELTGSLICVTPPGANASDITITVGPSTTTSSAETAVPRPTNGAGNTTAPCASWYTVQDEDYCQIISIRQNIALQDFYFLNPSIDVNCTNLWLGTAYCVEAVGDINTYAGYPYSTSAIYTLTASNYITTTSTVVETLPSVTPIIPLPLAPGTNSNCTAYVEYMPVDPYQDQSMSEDARLVTEHMNSCEFAMSGYAVSIDEFLSWNPSLASFDPCYLQQGYSYCALNDSSAVGGENPKNDLCFDIAAAYPGTISTCSCFTLIMGSDANHTSCADVAQDANIPLSDLTTWNPWTGTNCDTGLFAGLLGVEERPVCIGVSSTSSPTSTTTSAATTTSLTAPPAPTQTGIVSGCTAYYTAKAGDGCLAITNQFAITLDQFYAWNPAVGTNCGNLWSGYAYCVAI